MSIDEIKEIKFYGTREEYGQFSNFYLAEIQLDDEIWPTTEHFFQAQKFAPDHELVAKVRDSPTPGAAAKQGRRRDLPLRDDWEQVKEDIMYKALRAKFTQHQSLKELLLNTGNAKIIEHTTNDKYWGDGGGDGNGKNRLGELLMRLRTELSGQVENE